MKLIPHLQTSNMLLLQLRNGQEVSSHTLLAMQLLLRAADIDNYIAFATI